MTSALSSMSVLVTGGAGFIGSHLVERLVRDGEAGVTVLDNLTRGTRANLGAVLDRIRFFEGDLLDPEQLEQAVEGADVIFHLAAQSNVMDSVRDPAAAFSNNAAGTFAILECARRHHVRRLVFASSREVYGEPLVLPVPETAAVNPKNPYGASKAAGETYCRLYAWNGPDTAILRLTNVYGPRDYGRVIPLFIDRALRNAPMTIYGGAQWLDFVWVDVVVDALIQASRQPGFGQAVNVGSGRGCALEHLAQRIRQCARSHSPLVEAESRAAEVVRFVSDIAQATKRFGISRPDDPLAHLPQLVEAARAGLGRVA